MTTYMKELIEHRFNGDILAFRCYCLRHKVEPREDAKDHFTQYPFYRVRGWERKGLAKRLILMSR